jgi:hypothetical protein
MIVAAFLVFGVVVALAAFFVIREAGRIAKEPPAALFDPDDAYDWVVEHLPDDVAATLTPDDVRRILGFQVEFFERTNTSPNGSPVKDDESVVVGSGDEIAYILERAAATGEKYLPEQVDAVVEAQLSYLRFIGAVGPAAEPGDSSPPTSAI